MVLTAHLFCMRGPSVTCSCSNDFNVSVKAARHVERGSHNSMSDNVREASPQSTHPVQLPDATCRQRMLEILCLRRPAHCKPKPQKAKTFKLSQVGRRLDHLAVVVLHDAIRAATHFLQVAFPVGLRP